MNVVRLGTRGSQLALFQAHAVATRLREEAQIECEITIIKTSGDRLAEASLSEIGGKRLFVKEIEDALLAGDIDLAVHSSKDMPAQLPPRLEIGAVLAREDARDAIVLAGGTGALTIEDVIARLGREPRIGTSSIRRTAQLARLFPGASFLPIRGNLDTRLRKLDEGQFDAIVLAAAGLNRLQHRERISTTIPVDVCVPAPGQGTIAVEIRSGDSELRHRLLVIDDAAVRAALVAERAVVTVLGGGCQMPIGAHATTSAGLVAVLAIVISPDGERAVRAEAKGPVEQAADVGAAAAGQLLEQGAGQILADLQHAAGRVEGLQP